MMRKPKSISGFFINSNAALLLALFLFFGCSASDTRVKKSEQDNRVNSISTVDEGDSIKVEVLGDGPFTFEYSKQAYPLSVILYLQGASSTDVEIGAIEGGDIVSGISSSESGDNPPVSRIEISLKKDVPYDVYAEGDALYVSLSKTADALAGRPPDTEEGGDEGAIAESDIDTQQVAANAGGVKNLSKVETAKEANGVVVFVRADGEIADFESFTVEETIESPARIVFDIFNVNTSKDEEQQIDVGAGWVDSVRYKGYKDRIRLVLDTRNQYLTSFFRRAFRRRAQNYGWRHGGPCFFRRWSYGFVFWRFRGVGGREGLGCLFACIDGGFRVGIDGGVCAGCDGTGCFK